MEFSHSDSTAADEYADFVSLDERERRKKAGY